MNSKVRTAAVVGLCALTALTSCSDDKASNSSPSKKAKSTAVSPTTTSKGADSKGSSTSTPKGGPTTSRAPDVFTAKGEPSPMELGTGAPEPEFPQGKNGTEEVIPDGDYDMLVVQVDEPTHALLVNVVELYRGDKAKSQAIEDKRLAPGEDPIADFYVRDLSPKMRQIKLASSVEVSSQATENATSASGVDDSQKTLIDRLSTAPNIPYRVTVSKGVVTKLVIPDVVDPTADGPG